jgi:serine/threonine protein kinase
VTVLGRRRQRDPFAGFDEVVEVGRGAFATVYRATEVGTARPVAVKVLHGLAPAGPDLEALEMEARALGTVSEHPNIVTLHRTVLRADGQPMLVMELCTGSLADRLARTGPIPVREAVAIGVKLAGALESAHRAGVLHRDLKPSNVLLTAYGEPVLADFGIAGLHGTASGRSRLSGLTVHHAAPEVLLGSEATPPSDVYGLASVLHELLTGHPPFFVTDEEDAAAVQRRIIVDPPPRLAAPGATAPLRDLLRRAMDKDPGRRPASALELAQRLRALERDAGWPTTPCLIDGLDDLPPIAPEVDPPAGDDGGRTAAETGPRLGLSAGPLGGGPAPGRRLAPVPGRRREALPGRDAPLLPSAPTRVVRHSRPADDLPAPTGRPVDLSRDTAPPQRRTDAAPPEASDEAAHEAPDADRRDRGGPEDTRGA